MTFLDRLVLFALIATGIQYGIGASRLLKWPREAFATLIGWALCPWRWRPVRRERIAAAVLWFLACSKCSGAWIGVALHFALRGLSPFSGLRLAWLAAGLSGAVLVSVLRSHMDLTATTEGG